MSKTAADKPAMELRYPSSFFGLLLAGFGIVVLPLIAGLISNAISFERLSEQSQQAVFNATAATQNTRQLSTLMLSMERSARLYASSGDRSLIDTYKQSRDSFNRTLEPLNALPLTPEMRASAADIQKRESDLFATLTAKGPSSEVAQQFEREYGQLSQRAQSLNTLASALIEQEVAELKASAAKARKQILWQLLAMIPSALLLIAGFTYLLARPIRDLAASIHRLGEGKLAQRIRVSGPRDIERLGEQLDWLRQRLISLEDQKTRFFQHVSHELKTPLTALREGSDILSDGVVGQLTDEQREVARILKQNSLTLEKLIQDLLAYSQSPSRDALEKKVAMDIKPVSLKQLIDDVTARQKLAIVSKSLVVTKECEDFSFQGDAEKVRVIIDNLLSNAVKYAPTRGAVTLRVGSYKKNAVIDVIDNGPGISEEDRERVFDPFYRGKAASTETKGTGLGLAIVRDYVALHGGTVEVLNAGGAHFRVILPAPERQQT